MEPVPRYNIGDLMKYDGKHGLHIIQIIVQNKNSKDFYYGFVNEGGLVWEDYVRTSYLYIKGNAKLICSYISESNVTLVSGMEKELNIIKEEIYGY